MDSIGDCNLHEMIYGSSPAIDASLTPSYATVPTTITSNNNQMLDDWGLDVIVNGFYPTNNTSSSIPTPLDQTIYWDQPNILPSSITPTINNQSWDGLEPSMLSPTKPNYQRNLCFQGERKREKRIYKMPMEALKNDVWSWRKYGEKSVDGSPYPSGQHNHPIPTFIKDKDTLNSKADDCIFEGLGNLVNLEKTT
ncbi:hypothetical protein E3N88_07942 [Mikania micrantha]|uniref:WRKY domain-containing protein n=1 Tax=Mikania micrantha TaxID=192012 RepID=A0A5N6PFW0_9ASTR|nr:hypothetical protein E3N88_07942 [Mikania micrantha]